MKICALCRHFTTQHHPEQGAVGMGHCVGFLEATLTFVAFDNETCSLFKPASQVAARQKYIEVQREKKA